MKTYSTKIDQANNLVTVTYSPDTSYQDRVNLLDELIEISKSSPGINILIDVKNAKNTMTVDEQQKYGHLLASNAKQFKRDKTAILIKYNANPHPYIVHSAYAGGYRDICEFDDESEAIKWLSGSIK